eukprot:jgi/Botrbrau1/2339/Bobra.39_1s0028.1
MIDLRLKVPCVDHALVLQKMVATQNILCGILIDEYNTPLPLWYHRDHCEVETNVHTHVSICILCVT